MFLLEWTANDLLMITLVAIAMIGTVLWLVPSAKAPRKRAYTQSEITAYDRQIPRYFIAAAVAVVLGSAHILVKNFPGFWNWLWEAGYGGHLFRDLSNSHIIIVGGGTVLLTGLTWYLLPRFTNRPLYSNTLASASFWFTLIGVFGFYLSWLVLGLVEGSMVRHGMDYMAAKEALGAWHRVPTRMTASIMGLGYWTYVLNTFLTVFAARSVLKKPFGHLNKFVVVSAGALFIGTVQGVLQVLPANADWIHYAGKFGEYIDPISHAHINLVTGMMVMLAGSLVYFSPRLGGKAVSARTANRIFWTLVPGSLAFYLTFLFSGLILGNAVNGTGGIHAPALVPFLSKNVGLLMAVSGSLMLIGFWVYFITMWRILPSRNLVTWVKTAHPGAFWLFSSFALVIGTFQGLLQALPVTMPVFTVAEEVPNIHAQLNMIGGVLLALIGLVYLLIPELLGVEADQRLARISLLGIAGGIAGYYLSTITTGLVRLFYLRQGFDDVASAARLGWAAPLIILLTAIPMFVGFGAFGLMIFKATRLYRAAWAADIRQMPARYTGPMPGQARRIPQLRVLGVEFVSGLFGFPGLGWLYSGQALPAVALLLAGPGITWALLPMLFSPYAETAFSQLGWPVLLIWLPLSALLSTLLLGLVMWRKEHRPQAVLLTLSTLNTDPSEKLPAGGNQSSTKAPEAQTPRNGQRRRRKIPMGTAIGIGLMLMTLFSIPVIPLVMGIPANSSGQPLMSSLPDRAEGAYLYVGDGQQSGLLKLFPWSFPVEDFPPESPAISPAQLLNIVVRQKGLDAPSSYMLYHLDDGDAVRLTYQETSFQRELSIVPGMLAPGNYMLDIPIGGMFAGREYYYFRIDPQVTTLPPLVPVEAQVEPVSAADQSAAPAPPGAASFNLGLEIFPFISFLISAVMAAIMLVRMRRKSRPQEAAWIVAFVMFSIAAGCQVIGDVFGWTALLARIYYVTGASLVVGWLGLGTWLVVVRKDWLRKIGTWVMIFLSGFGIGLVSLSAVNLAALAADGWQALERPLTLTILTIAINSLGTLLLVGGALWSAWVFWRKGIQRGRMIGLFLLAAGALSVAAGGSLTRLGHQQYLYIAMAAGIGLMFWGYLKTIQPATDIVRIQSNFSSQEQPAPGRAAAGEAATG